MSEVWINEIKEQSAALAPLSRRLSAALARPDLTLEQATHLYEAMERHAQAAGRLLTEMEQDGADEALIEAATTLEKMASEMAAAVCQRLLDLR